MKLVNTVKAVAVVAALLAAGQASAGTFATDIGGHHRFHVGKHMCPAPVPEAETWAMMGVGLTMLGALARRRMAKK